MTKTQIIQDALNLKADDIWGPQTDAAVEEEKRASLQRHGESVGETPTAGNAGGTPAATPVDARSEGNIETLLPPVQEVARKFIQRLMANHIHAKVISGNRTYVEQNSLYEQGRSKPGRIVTNARGGQSNHNFGIAFDIGIFTGDGKYLPESPLYKAAGKIGKELGLSWGGDWKSIQDEPHFELKPKWAEGITESEMLAELRKRTAQGAAVFT